MEIISCEANLFAPMETGYHGYCMLSVSSVCNSPEECVSILCILTMCTCLMGSSQVGSDSLIPALIALLTLRLLTLIRDLTRLNLDRAWCSGLRGGLMFTSGGRTC